MAFIPTLNPANDPNYLNQSKGFSDVKPDLGTASLISGIGNLVSQGAQAFDKAILQDQIRTPLESDLSKIVDSKGGNITPAEAPAIAGTGARGSRYSAVGAGADDLTESPALPVSIQQGKAGLDRMKAAFQQGELSETKFRTEVEAAAQKYKTQYPAYSDQIDAITAGYLGSSPANKVRESVLRDMMSLAAAGNAGQKRAEAFVHQYKDEIATLYPHWGVNQAVQNIDTIKNDPNVLQLAAKSKQYEWNKLDWETSKGVPRTDIAKNNLRQEGDTLVQGVITGATKATGVDLPAMVQKIYSGALAKDSPEKIDEAHRQLQLLEDQARMAFQQKARARDPSNPKSQSYSQWMTPAELKAMEDEVVAPITMYKDAVKNGRWDTVASITTINQLRAGQDHDKLVTMFPEIRSAAALQKAFGNTPIPAEIAQTIMGNKDGKLNAFLTGSWLNAKNTQSPTPPPPLGNQVNGAPGGGLNGDGISKLIDLHKTLALSPDADVARRSMDVLYKETSVFDRLNNKEKITMMSKMGSPDMTTRAKALGPETFAQYYSWMEHAFTQTARQGADDIQEALQNKEVDVKLNPKTLQFDVKTLGVGPPVIGRGTSMSTSVNSATGEFRPAPTDPAQVAADKLNLSLALLKPAISERYQGQEMGRLMTLLGSAGVRFDAPKDPSIWSRLGQAVMKVFPEKGPSAYDPYGTKVEGKSQDRVVPGNPNGLTRLDDNQGSSLGQVYPLLQKMGKELNIKNWEKMLDESPEGKIINGDVIPTAENLYKETRDAYDDYIRQTKSGTPADVEKFKAEFDRLNTGYNKVLFQIAVQKALQELRGRQLADEQGPVDQAAMDAGIYDIPGAYQK